MPGNCKCNNCCPPKCENPCLLLSEPCNPCPPKQITFCVPLPSLNYKIILIKIKKQ